MSEITYLSDEELLWLMDAAEAELQPAPPDLADSILAALEERAEREIPSGAAQGKAAIPFRELKPPRSKRAEFAAFCAEVAFTAAAAAAIVISLSLRPTPTPSREEVLQRKRDSFSAMIGQSYIVSDYITNRFTFGGNTNETE